MTFTYIVIFFTILYLTSIYYGNKLNNVITVHCPLLRKKQSIIQRKKISKVIKIKFSNPELQNIKDKELKTEKHRYLKWITRRLFSNKIIIVRTNPTDDDDIKSK